MSSLRDIRKRLHSTESVQQITKAMEMVSAARLKRAQDNAKASSPFAEKLRQMISYVSREESAHPLFAARTVKKTAVVIVAGEKGLCGRYNASLLDASDKFLTGYKSDEIDLILIGTKAIDHYEGGPYNIRLQLGQMQGKLKREKIKELSDQWLDWYEKEVYDEVWLIYTHYVNTMTREPVVEKFLNVDKSRFENLSGSANYIFEPSQKRVLLQLLPLYCFSIIQNMLNEAWASELSSRVEAMRAATKNADEMIEKLTLAKNKVRQEGITREILEITSGAERFK